MPHIVSGVPASSYGPRVHSVHTSPVVATSRRSLPVYSPSEGEIDEHAATSGDNEGNNGMDIDSLRDANEVVGLDEMVRQPLFCIARRPIADTLLPLDVGRMDVTCPHCNALHWLGESTVSSRSSRAEFETCCAHGKISLPLLSVPPRPLCNLFVDESNAQYRPQ